MRKASPKTGIPDAILRRRLPLDAVVAHIEAFHVEDFRVDVGHIRPLEGRRISVAHVAHLCGLNRGVVYRYADTGIPWISADKVAARLGVHPLEIWQDFYTEEDLQCA